MQYLLLVALWNSSGSSCFADSPNSTDKLVGMGIGSLDFKVVEESYPQLQALSQAVDDMAALAQTEEEKRNPLPNAERETHVRLQDAIQVATIVRVQEQQKITDGIAALASISGIDVIVDKSAIFHASEKIKVADVTNRFGKGLQQLQLNLDIQGMEKCREDLEKLRPHVMLGKAKQD